MTPGESRILETLAGRFSRSAHAEGGSALRLTPERSFADFLSAGPDVYESFLEAAEKLESDGIVTLAWKRFRKGEELASITLRDAKALFVYLGRPLPSDQAERARDAAREALARVADDPSRAFFSWLAENIRSRDVADGDRRIDLARAITDFTLLTDSLAVRAKDGFLSGITPRALSITLFSDSKRIESLLAELAPLLSRARRSGVPVPDTTAVERAFPETLVAGPLSFILDEGAEPGDSDAESASAAIANPQGCVIGIPLVTAARISRVEPAGPADSVAADAPRLVTVENLETFYALATCPTARSKPLADAFLYTGGHPNRAVQRLLAAFARSGFSVSHAGDLDPEGILILQEVMDAAERPVTPIKMDAETFDSYLPHSRELEKTALSRAALIRDDTRALPGMDGLLARVLNTGRGVEQEAIEY